MGDVVRLPVLTRLNASPDMVIEEALSAGLTDVVIIGWDAVGQEFFVSSIADGAEVNWLLDRMKHRLMSEEN